MKKTVIDKRVYQKEGFHPDVAEILFQYQLELIESIHGREFSRMKRNDRMEAMYRSPKLLQTQ